MLNHFQSNLVRLFEAAYPSAEPLRLRATIDPALPEPLHPRGQIALQELDQTLLIIRIGRRDDHSYNQSQLIEQNMPFAFFNLLGPVKADVCAWRDGLDTLVIHTTGGRLG